MARPEDIYSEKEIAWLQAHQDKRLKEITSGFNIAFNHNFSIYKVKYLLKRFNFTWDRSKLDSYSEEEDMWLKENCPNKTYEELLTLFNKRFCEHVVNLSSFKQHMNKVLKIYCVDKFHHKYTKEENEWLKNMYLDKELHLSSNELAKLFNKQFKPSVLVSGDRIKEHCIKGLKLKRGWNAGQFGIGSNTKEHAPIGTIMAPVQYSKSKSGSSIYKRIKVSCNKDVAKKSGYNAYYMPYQKYLYEQAHGTGSVPEGSFVIFLDGDSNNFDLSNLAVVDKKINGKLCFEKVHGMGKVTEAFIECAKLEDVIKSF